MELRDAARALAPAVDLTADDRAHVRAALIAATVADVGHATVAPDATVGRQQRAMRRTRFAVVGAAFATVAVLVGIVAAVSLWPRATGPAALPTATPDYSRTYECRGTAVPGAALRDAQGIEEIDPEARALIEAGAEGRDGGPWILVSEMPDEVIAIRSVSRDVDVRFDTPTDHQLVVVDTRGGTGAWGTATNSDCLLAAELDGLNAPGVALDPAHPLDPASTEVHLLLHEDECASAQTAEGRVEVVSLDASADRVAVVLGIRPLESATCPSNPPTPYVLHLAEPLGDRVVVNAGLFDAPVLEPARLE